MSNDVATVFINPFHVQWTDRYFVGRQDELRVFANNLHGLKQGQQSHLLVAGVHGTGKTFYLNKLVEIAKSAKCVGIMAECPESPPREQASSILSRIIKDMQAQLASAGSPSSRALSDDFDNKEQSKFFSFPKRDHLAASDLEDDFSLLTSRAKAGGFDGVVVCIDEGQRSTRAMLSGFKNALSRVPGMLITLSWRLSSDAKGAVQQARQELVNRMVDTEGDKDIGAAAFFSSATAMGPFKTDDEVAAYFRARLAGNAIAFCADVTSHLSEIANRVPRPMTDLAHDVYESALKANITSVDLSLLEECFRARYAGEMKQATDLCADLSPQMMTVLKAFCRRSRPATALDLVKDTFSATPADSHPLIAAGVAAQLDNLCRSNALLQKSDDGYAVVDSFCQYALRLTLDLTR